MFFNFNKNDPTTIDLFFYKYSLKNYRVLDICKTKLTEGNRNFEPNLLSFSLLNHQLQAVCMPIL